MRILGVSRRWNKLRQNFFTTYRFQRKDRDWGIEEVVQVVYKPRSKGREILGIARIIRKESKNLQESFNYFSPNKATTITPDEAEADGFTGMHGGGDTRKMKQFFQETYGYSRCWNEPINKLMLYWLERNDL